MTIIFPQQGFLCDKHSGGLERFRFLCRGLLVAVLSCCLVDPASAAEPEPVTELEVVLKDGSRAFGTTKGDSYVATTEFGKVLVPFRVIRRMEREQANNQFLFTLKNKDVVKGELEQPGFALQALEGERNILFSEVASIEFITYVPAKKGSLKKGLKVHFKFEGRDQEMITNETDPKGSGRLINSKREKGTVVFDGNGGHIHLANDEKFEEVEAFTVSIWAKLKDFGPGGYANEHGYLVNKGDDMWWNPGWCLGYSKKSGAGKKEIHPGPLPALFIVGTEVKGGHSRCRVSSTTLISTGKWYHLVGTYDGKVARIYLNGRMEGEQEYNQPVRQDRAPLLLGGGRLGGTTFGNHFTTRASIDNFRFYDRALTQGEIRLLYQTEMR